MECGKSTSFEEIGFRKGMESQELITEILHRHGETLDCA